MTALKAADAFREHVIDHRPVLTTFVDLPEIAQCDEQSTQLVGAIVLITRLDRALHSSG